MILYNYTFLITFNKLWVYEKKANVFAYVLNFERLSLI